MKPASTRQICQVRHIAGDGCKSFPSRSWQRTKKTDGIGMLGITKKASDRSGLHYCSGVHHTNPVSHFSYDTKIMCDHQSASVILSYKGLHESQYLCLNSDIKGCSRLIGQEQVRFTGHSHSDKRPLLHTA